MLITSRVRALSDERAQRRADKERRRLRQSLDYRDESAVLPAGLDRRLLQALSDFPELGAVFLEVVLVEEMRRALPEGRAALPAVGAARPAEGLVPFVGPA